MRDVWASDRRGCTACLKMLTTRGQGLLRIILQLRLIGYLHPEVSAFRLSIPSYILNIWKQTLVQRWTEEEYESCIYQTPVTYVRWARYEIPVRRAVAKGRLVSFIFIFHFQYHYNVDAVTVRILPWVADNSGYFHMYENKILKLSFVVQSTLEDIFTFQPFLHVIWRCNCRKNLNWSSQIYYFLTKVCVFSVF